MMGGGSGGGFSGTRGAPIQISDKRMYQDGSHFNKHGREMGYGSKKEYGDAAQDFARTYQSHPDAQVYEGVWNGTGRFVKKFQRIIVYGNRSVVVDVDTGQLVDFYEGSEMRGLTRILRIR